MVKITYKKTNQPYFGAGEFTVEDWGVFDRTRVRFLQTFLAFNSNYKFGLFFATYGEGANSIDA